ncbi:MAG: hypothetical protein ACRDQ9_02945 [Pseudonocardiaceae bacterium]
MSRKRTNYDAALNRNEPGTPPAGATAVRTRPVRITVDLAPPLHRVVKDWVRATAADLGRDVALAEVIRALLAQLDADPELAREVRARLTASTAYTDLQ